MVARSRARWRWSVPLLCTLGACSALGHREQRSLREVLLDPVASVDARGAELRAQMTAGDAVGPGVRVAFVHHALRAGADVDAAGLLAREAQAWPEAATFLQRYAGLMQVAPAPTSGAVSRALLVLPPVDQTGQRAVAADLLASIAEPLRAAGAWVVPVEVGLDLVARLGGDYTAFGRRAPEPDLVRRLCADLGLDACFAVHVVEWRAHLSTVVEAVDHDVRYTLFGADGTVRWQRTVAGSYLRREPVVTFSPHDDDPVFYWPSGYGPVFDDTFEFARALNASALAPLRRR